MVVSIYSGSFAADIAPSQVFLHCATPASLLHDSIISIWKYKSVIISSLVEFELLTEFDRMRTKYARIYGFTYHQPGFYLQYTS